MEEFAARLRQAIADRGLTLAGLSHRLGGHGVSLSAATLSYWARGLRRPEGLSSLAAVRALEDILRVPQGSLLSCAEREAPRRRGRVGAAPLPVADLWPTGDAAITRLIERIGVPYEGRRTVSVHERMWIDAGGAEQRVRVTSVLEATKDGIDRFLVMRDDIGVVPELRVVSGGRVGRVCTDRRGRVLVGEVWLDQPLNRGQRTAVEYELDIGADGRRTVDCTRRFANPVHQYVLEVAFDPTAVPVRCYQITPDGPDPVVSIGAAHTARLIVLDGRAGTFGLRWEWA
ncbi:hypothetical protein [Kutzneria sp. NPDC051319]|uniref:helix-turn-helix domain-containing protein n=1 Tax=Kutzneria sp. NPDC051319 TaxID=3155047 RepID=UPI0034492C0B